MNLIDFLIIYLACGTPFGMYHFINNRKSGTHWIKSLLTVFVWIPYGFIFFRLKIADRLSTKNNENSSNYDFDPESQLVLEKTRKSLERIFCETGKSIPIFEFRETIDRYIGLTLAIHSENQKVPDKVLDFYEISGNDSKILAARCLHRRNLRLLIFHQRLARRDLLKFIFDYKNQISDAEYCYNLLLTLVDVLQDNEAKNLIETNFSLGSQSENETSVNTTEKEIWTLETRKQLPDKPLALPLKIINLPTNSPFKD